MDEAVPLAHSVSLIDATGSATGSTTGNGESTHQSSVDSLALHSEPLQHRLQDTDPELGPVERGRGYTISDMNPASRKGKQPYLSLQQVFLD